MCISLLNKPEGVVSASRDKRDYHCGWTWCRGLPPAGAVPGGRLDRGSTGLYC